MLVTVDHTEATNAIRESLAAELRALGLVVDDRKLAAMARNVAQAVIALDTECPDCERHECECGADPDYGTAAANGVGR